MIKKFMSKAEDLSVDAWIAILNYIDSNIDNHEKRLNKLEERMNEFEDEFNAVQAKSDAEAKTRASIKKILLGIATPIAVALILKWLGGA